MPMILVDEKKLEDFIRGVEVDCYVCPVQPRAYTCLQAGIEMPCVTTIKLYLQNKLKEEEK